MVFLFLLMYVLGLGYYIIQSNQTNKNSQFAGLEEDEPIPREWVQKMDEWQHELEASITWDAGDVLLVDVSNQFSNEIVLSTNWSFLLQNFAAQHARWGWEGDRKVMASFWDQPGVVGEPITTQSCSSYSFQNLLSRCRQKISQIID